MGTYVNPQSESMERAVRSEIYMDKTGLLKILNKSIGSEKCYFAVSRARRFGKSMAAGMIDAYYSRGCDSRELFSPYEIAKDPDFETYLNKFNVLHFDVASFLNEGEDINDTIKRMDQDLLEDMISEFPVLMEAVPRTTAKAMAAVYLKEKIRFVVIIDEYDCIIRDAAENEELIRSYLRYLRGFFKTEESKHFLALGYITGILPIKKVNGESALNNFMEYTMTEPRELLPYFGFTQEELEVQCKRYSEDPGLLRDWDDVGEALRRSGELLRAVWKGDTEKVARVIAESHQDYASIINFHDENSLATAIMMSFYTARADYYVKRELPAGRGFADIVFIPKQNRKTPAMIVELKWNRSANTAILQIRAKTYTGALSDYHGEILLVGINYTKKSGKYTCRIETVSARD